MLYVAEMKHQYLQFLSDEKLMPEIDLPPEMQYSITYMTIISQCGKGKNATSETRAQALFTMHDLIENFKMCDFCYSFKSSLVQYLNNIYFDTEKQMSEDFISQAWQIIDLIIQDLQKFIEVMQRSRRSNITRVVRANVDIESQEKRLTEVQVDVNKNFSFVTAFGRFKVSE